MRNVARCNRKVRWPLGLAFATGGGKAPKKTEACTPLNLLLPASFDGFR